MSKNSLTYYRELRGISREKLASPATVERWEKGTRPNKRDVVPLKFHTKTIMRIKLIWKGEHHVGTLTRNPEGMYEFRYSPQARVLNRKVGYPGIYAFSDWDKVYKSANLFPVFANRVMPKSRPDYPQMLARLGLPPGTVDPVTRTTACRT